MCFVNEQPNSCKIILDGNRKLLPTRRIPHPNRTGSTPALEESLEPCCFSSTGWWRHCWDCAHQHDIGSKCAWFRKKRKHPPKLKYHAKNCVLYPWIYSFWHKLWIYLVSSRDRLDDTSKTVQVSCSQGCWTAS